MTKDGRIRIFEIVQFEEYWTPEQAFIWLDRINCSYICVKHDKDKDDKENEKRAHFHCVVRLKDARNLDEISKNCNVEKQYIEIKKNFKDACAYLFHLTSKARMDHKYEYDGSAVISCKHTSYEEIKNRSIDYDVAINHDEEIKQLLYKYGNCEISKSDVLSQMSAKDYDKHGLTFRKMKEYRIMKVRIRQMNVIYITGVSGGGKTTLAKYMARMQNYDYFISGSGKDVLDGYDKEECIILDDLRADVFTKAELFKLTDNNTNSSVKSRFQNKDISFCKLMIITSIKAPHDLYDWELDSKETFKQFARRINNQYIDIDESRRVITVEYQDTNKIKRTIAPFNMNDVFTILGIETTLGPKLMDDIFCKIKENCEKDKNSIKEIEDIDLPF